MGRWDRRPAHTRKFPPAGVGVRIQGGRSRFDSRTTRAAEHRSDPASGGSTGLARVAALGHSFGGNAALEWCRTDQRCLAAVNLDGALWTEVGRIGLDRPAMQVLAEHREFAVTSEDAVKAGAAPNVDWFEAEKAITFGGWRVQRRAQPGYTMQVGGATHLSFMDVPSCR